MDDISLRIVVIPSILRSIFSSLVAAAGASPSSSFISSSFFLEVLIDGGADVEFLNLIETYLMAQGSKSMVNCLATSYLPYKSLAKAQDWLG